MLLKSYWTMCVLGMQIVMSKYTFIYRHINVVCIFVKTPCHFFANEDFRKIQKHTPLRHIGTCPSAISRTQGQPKKKRHSTLCKFLTKKVKFRRFQKTENRRKSVTGAKMHIFEKFKKGTLAAPHELLNPKMLMIWTNQKKRHRF